MVGSTIGSYRILAKLGEGGMGQVYLADDRRLHRKVALKLLPPATAADEDANARLLREATAAATLDHPNICAIYDLGEEHGRRFIVMSYVDGETLDRRLRKAPLTIDDALPILTQALNGDDPVGRAALAFAYAVSGDRGNAQALLDQLIAMSKTRYYPPYQIATIYAGLGDADRAFEWLEKAFEERSPGLTFLKTEPMLDSLRADKRFDDLVHRVENTSAK